MRDVFATTAAWLEQKRRFALATLVMLRESATAPVGTTIAVDERGEIVGNVGAGCYETAIVEAVQRTAADGATATFEHVYRAKETIFLIGATALAAELATIAARMDFKTVVVDPRPAFATARRLPAADTIVRRWPDEYLPAVLTGETPVVILSHDAKFDLPALSCALRSAAPYIGLLGSRRSQAARRDALRAQGFDECALARINGPAGLDIGGSTPAETAVSILAEIVASRHQCSGAPLRSTSVAIHRRREISPANA